MANIITGSSPSNIPLIHDDNYQDHLDWKGQGKGLITRNFHQRPQGYLACAASYSEDLIDPAAMPDMIADQERNKSSLEHWIRDNKIDALDQNGKGYCWAHSTTFAMMMNRLINNLPYVRLSAYMVACLVKGYRDQGGSCDESLSFIAENGVASEQFWPMQSMQRSNDNAAMRANAQSNKVVRWTDLAQSGSIVKQQLASRLLRNEGTAIDLDWWSHSICAVRLMSWFPFIVRFRNSWGNSYGDYGFGDLQDRKAIPDGACGPLTVIPSLN